MAPMPVYVLFLFLQTWFFLCCQLVEGLTGRILTCLSENGKNYFSRQRIQFCVVNLFESRPVFFL